MNFACASRADLPATMQTIAACVAKLHSFGIDQWDEEYPDKSVIEDAIESRSLYVCK
jgi:hypothetical protein